MQELSDWRAVGACDETLFLMFGTFSGTIGPAPPFPRNNIMRGANMLGLLVRLLKHPSRSHHFLQSRSQPGMMTCKICRHRVKQGR